MSSPRFGYAALALLVACWMLAPVPAWAIFSPRRVITVLTPPPDLAMPLQTRPPEPPPPDEGGPTEPPVDLQEVPEPATLLTGLVGSALAAAWWRTRRRKTDAPPAE